MRNFFTFFEFFFGLPEIRLFSILIYKQSANMPKERHRKPQRSADRASEAKPEETDTAPQKPQRSATAGREKRTRGDEAQPAGEDPSESRSRSHRRRERQHRRKEDQESRAGAPALKMVSCCRSLVRSSERKSRSAGRWGEREMMVRCVSWG